MPVSRARQERVEKKLEILNELKHQEIDKVAKEYVASLITSNELMAEMLHLADLFQVGK